jgi:hypothetical protein
MSLSSEKTEKKNSLRNDKRRTGRSKTRLPVIYSSHGLQYNGCISDISFSGLFIRTRRPFKPGVPVEISIDTESGSKVCLKGLSVRANNYGVVCAKNGMGIKLDSQPEAYRGLVKDVFLKKLKA